MNKIDIALLIAGIAFLVALGGYFYPQISAGFGSASCSGVSGCTAFPGTLRSDTQQALSGQYIGGTAAANEVTVWATASAWYPQTALTLGSITTATSSTSTPVIFGFGTANGFAAGDACQVFFNGAPNAASFGADAFLTAVATNTATATVTFWNGASTALTINTTSSLAAGASTTLKVTCQHTGI